jgi:hypothetical protein
MWPQLLGCTQHASPLHGFQTCAESPGFVLPAAADVDGALALLQWVLSAKPDAAAAEQQLQAALKLVRLTEASSANCSSISAGWGTC